MQHQIICDQLKGLVSSTRFAHILRVAETARDLAVVHGCNPEKAYLAGLIHDTAKQMTPRSAQEMGVQLSPDQIDLYGQFAKVWHALVAPTVCQQLFGIEDVDVLTAAKWHTTGTQRMTLLEQIVFVSDYIEPGRDVSDRTYIADLARVCMSKATFALSSSTLVSLCERGLNIHPESIACYNYYHSVLPRSESEAVAAAVFRIKFLH